MKKRTATADPLLNVFEAKLAASGLDLRDAKRLGYRPIPAARVARELDPSLEARGGFVLPYHDLHGKPDGFWRFRYLDPPVGFRALAAKTRRYAQAPGTPPRVYFPPLLDWVPLARDPARPLVVTEGELKAACATRLGFPTLGLGGVYAWRSARRGVELLPELDALEWRERVVYLAFDADIGWKPEVRRALTHLAETLLARGARVHEVTLPQLEDPAGGAAKTGLDDLLVARGASELEALIAAAPEYAPSRELWTLSNEVAYVRDPGVIVQLETGTRYSANAFKEHAYGNRWLVERVDGRDGKPKLTKRKLALAWLEWPQRAELARFVYAPGAPRETADGAYNLWKGWGVEPERGDVGPWRDLLAYLCADDDAAIAWLEAWFAYPLQHPGAKLLTAVIIWGAAQGTGKSLLGYLVGDVYGSNFVEIHPSNLHDRFNEWAVARQFVLGDEIAGGDRRADGELVKRLITQKTVRVNQKYVPSFELTDCLNYYFTSNHPDPFYLEPTDRRFFVVEVARPPRELEFYRRVDAWRAAGGARFLFDRLLRLDLQAFDPNAPAPATTAKAEMTALAASEVDAWVADLLADPDRALGALGVAAPVPPLWTAAQLRALYDPEDRRRLTTNGLARALRRAGVPTVGTGGVVRTRAAGLARLYAIRDRDRWLAASHGEIAATYDAAFAGAANVPRPSRF